MTAFVVEVAAIFTLKGAAVSAVEQATSSVVWVVEFTGECDVHVASAGIDKFALVDAAAGPALAAESVLAV